MTLLLSLIFLVTPKPKVTPKPGKFKLWILRTQSIREEAKDLNKNLEYINKKGIADKQFLLETLEID